MSEPIVSIVVPVYQGENGVRACIECLLAQDYPAERLEIILVDNNSTDNTGAIIQEHPVTYISEKRRGHCYARNAGIAAARGDLIAFTDADCLPRRDWISRLAPHFEDQSIGGAGGHIAAFPGDNLIENYISAQAILSQERFFQGKPHFPPFFATANVMYRKQALDAVGGFDPRFVHAGEDADLAWRIVAVGFRLVYERNSVVYHRHRTDLRNLIRQLAAYGVGSAQAFQKHRHRLDRGYWIEWPAYYTLATALVFAPWLWIVEQERFKRHCAWLDLASSSAYLFGRWKGSIKHGVPAI